jgi:V8-like Glu-specific endopeptidase
MKFSLVVLLVVAFQAKVMAKAKIIYGNDDRVEYHQVAPKFQAIANAVAGMVDKRAIINKSVDTVTLKSNYTLSSAERLCSSERFGHQKLVASCTGFLVAEDILVTAGHCFEQGYFSTPEMVCQSQAWIFALKTDKTTGNLESDIEKSRVFNCKKIIHVSLDNSSGEDFAVIKLDRKVEGVKPLKMRSSGKVSDETNLGIIGHPSGLPLKFSHGGRVLENDKSDFFVAAIDSFHGNSGSPVINMASGVVEGILVRGKTDYVRSYEADEQGNVVSCARVNVCDLDGKNCREETPGLNGEEVQRITTVSKLLKNR